MVGRPQILLLASPLPPQNAGCILDMPDLERMSPAPYGFATPNHVECPALQSESHTKSLAHHRQSQTRDRSWSTWWVVLREGGGDWCSYDFDSSRETQQNKSAAQGPRHGTGCMHLWCSKGRQGLPAPPA